MKNKEFFFKTEDLVIWRPTGNLTSSKIKEFIDFLNEHNSIRDPHFHRYIDLSQIKTISVNFDELSGWASFRKSFTEGLLKRKVKMAFLVTNTLSFGMARMYENLLDSKFYDIGIFYTIGENADFLDCDHKLLII